MLIIEAHADTITGILRIVFRNTGNTPLILRRIYEPHDVKIVNVNGICAEFILSFPYGADIDTFTLYPGSDSEHEINLATDFIYPASGQYRAWIEYDTSIKTAAYAKSTTDNVRVISNAVQFPIEIPSNEA